ncbi:hypothetical protein FI667_g16690, partial [Globisporangium splendens]
MLTCNTNSTPFDCESGFALRRRLVRRWWRARRSPAPGVDDGVRAAGAAVPALPVHRRALDPALTRFAQDRGACARDALGAEQKLQQLILAAPQPQLAVAQGASERVLILEPLVARQIVAVEVDGELSVPVLGLFIIQQGRAPDDEQGCLARCEQGLVPLLICCLVEVSIAMFFCFDLVDFQRRDDERTLKTAWTRTKCEPIV